MSHFTVLVVLPPLAAGTLKDAHGAAMPPLSAALQPFHEYECTGVRDQYVRFVDMEDEWRADYAKPVERWRDPADGTLYCEYDRVFYRGATAAEKAKIGSAGGGGYANGISYGTEYDRDGKPHLRVQMSPTVLGFTRVDVGGDEAYGSFEKWAKDWHGGRAIVQGGRWGKFTNPDAQWDWWSLGGRWSGLLLLKPGAPGIKGKPGMNPNIGSKNPTTEVDATGVDMARVGDLDLASMKIRNVRHRRECVESVIEQVMQAQNCTRDEVVARWCAYTAAVVQARKRWVAAGEPGWFSEYMNGLGVPELDREHNRSSGDTAALLGWSAFGAGVPEGCTDLESYITSAPALSTHAVLKDGVWHERGSMGWWGNVHDEKDEGTWAQEYDKLLASLHPDAVVAVVDCHI